MYNKFTVLKVCQNQWHKKDNSKYLVNNNYNEESCFLKRTLKIEVNKIILKIRTKYEQTTNSVVVLKTNKLKIKINKINAVVITKDVTRCDFVNNRTKWWKWNLSGEKGLLPR